MLCIKSIGLNCAMLTGYNQSPADPYTRTMPRQSDYQGKKHYYYSMGCTPLYA